MMSPIDPGLGLVRIAPISDPFWRALGTSLQHVLPQISCCWNNNLGGEFGCFQARIRLNSIPTENHLLHKVMNFVPFIQITSCVVFPLNTESLLGGLILVSMVLVQFIHDGASHLCCWPYTWFLSLRINQCNCQRIVSGYEFLRGLFPPFSAGGMFIFTKHHHNRSGLASDPSDNRAAYETLSQTLLGTGRVSNNGVTLCLWNVRIEVRYMEV